jgi:hypothetical protein
LEGYWLWALSSADVESSEKVAVSQRAKIVRCTPKRRSGGSPSDKLRTSVTTEDSPGHTDSLEVENGVT